MDYSNELKQVLDRTVEEANKLDTKYITPEILLDCIICTERVYTALSHHVESEDDIKSLRKGLQQYVVDNKVSRGRRRFDLSPLTQTTFEIAGNVLNSNYNWRDCNIEVEHVIAIMMAIGETFASYLLFTKVDSVEDFLSELIETSDCENEDKLFDCVDTMLSAKVFKMEGNTNGEGSTFNHNGEEEPEDVGECRGKLAELTECLNDTVTDKPIIGREKEIERTIEILSRESKNNPIHVGGAGVGKTKIVEGLVQKINADEVPNCIKGYTVYSVDMASVVAGTKYRGEFEKRIKYILDLAEKEGNCILYIDEIHTISGAGNAEGGLDAANILKPYLARGNVKVIGATTYDEYKKHIETNPALNRRFQKVNIEEPSRDDTIKILKGLREYYENFHEVCYTNEAIEKAVDLSIKYIKDRMLPDKAIDIIDEAGAHVKVHELEDRVVDDKLIEKVVSRVANVPMDSVQEDDVTKLKQLKDKLEEVVLGQTGACEAVSKAIKLSKAGLTDGTKPMASVLFVGPTGVGKTELAKTLSKEMGMKLIRFDMSEYMDKISVNKLIGASAGYVGYEEGGLLVDEIRKNPSCVLLLDEIEKAHPDIFNTLLQVMDYATLTDNRGNKADFKNVILIMTSNAGARDMGKRGIGFNSNGELGKESIDNSLKQVFSPEFRNRLSDVVVFNGIDNELGKQITKQKLNKLIKKLSEKNINAEVKETCVDYIVKKGIGPEVGAREIERIIDKELKSILVDEILFGKLKNGGDIVFEIKDGKPYIRKKREKLNKDNYELA